MALTPFAGCADEPIPGTPALEAQGVKATELEAWLASGLWLHKVLARSHLPRYQRLAAGLAGTEDGGREGRPGPPTLETPGRKPAWS